MTHDGFLIAGFTEKDYQYLMRNNILYLVSKIYYSSPAHMLFSDWNTYLAKACIRAAGHVGGAVSPSARLSLNVNSNPNPLVPSDPWLLLK